MDMMLARPSLSLSDPCDDFDSTYKTSVSTSRVYNIYGFIFYFHFDEWVQETMWFNVRIDEYIRYSLNGQDCMKGTR